MAVSRRAEQSRLGCVLWPPRGRRRLLLVKDFVRRRIATIYGPANIALFIAIFARETNDFADSTSVQRRHVKASGPTADNIVLQRIL